jgi:hypothetical protein
MKHLTGYIVLPLFKVKWRDSWIITQYADVDCSGHGL